MFCKQVEKSFTCMSFNSQDCCRVNWCTLTGFFWWHFCQFNLYNHPGSYLWCSLIQDEFLYSLSFTCNLKVNHLSRALCIICERRECCVLRRVWLTELKWGMQKMRQTFSLVVWSMLALAMIDLKIEHAVTAPHMSDGVFIMTCIWC